MRRSSYRSDETFVTNEIPEGVQHAEEVKVVEDRNEDQIKTNNLAEEPESASTSTSEGDKDGIHKSHSDGKEIFKL